MNHKLNQNIEELEDLEEEVEELEEKIEDLEEEVEFLMMQNYQLEKRILYLVSLLPVPD